MVQKRPENFEHEMEKISLKSNIDTHYRGMENDSVCFSLAESKKEPLIEKGVLNLMLLIQISQVFILSVQNIHAYFCTQKEIIIRLLICL